MIDPLQRPLIGVAIIVMRQGRVLLGKRINAHGAGTWQFPGGHLEYGESIEACARRELYEETGLRASRLRPGPFTNDIFQREGKHYVTLFMIADTVNGQVECKEPDKCERWEWFAWSDLPQPRFLPIVNLLKQDFTPLPSLAPAQEMIDELAGLADPQRAQKSRRFFKTGPGEYGEGDLFWGIGVPALRKMAKRHAQTSMEAIVQLLQSGIHEQRHLALFLLIEQYKTAGPKIQAKIIEIYLANTAFVNNWDLVDASAHTLLGAYLQDKERQRLYQLAASANLWERRIAMVATWHFIRQGQNQETFAIAARLLGDDQDLIHKAAGWMLREAGKRDQEGLLAFIEKHYPKMPRTMLRYAIERFDKPLRKRLLNGEFGPESRKGGR